MAELRGWHRDSAARAAIAAYLGSVRTSLPAIPVRGGETVADWQSPNCCRFRDFLNSSRSPLHVGDKINRIQKGLNDDKALFIK
jgi:hypothetical protein